MQILVADDDPVSRQLLQASTGALGHTVVAAENGLEAWDTWLLTRPRVVISDWMMPEIEGVELCRRIRARRDEAYTYFILLTSRGDRASYLAAMDAGADDFLTKPVDSAELAARLKVAERILGLHTELQQLEGLLPICSYCKRIRHEGDHWGSLEHYIEQRSKAEFTHGICPDCYAKHLEPQLRSHGGAP